MSHRTLPNPSVVYQILQSGRAASLGLRLEGCDSPAAAFESLVGGNCPFLLESGRQRPVTGRYSFFGCDPSWTLQSKGGNGNPFSEIRRRLNEFQTVELSESPPFSGGVVLALGYDAGRWFERLPEKARDDLNLPDLVAACYETVFAFDHLKSCAWVLTRLLPGSDVEKIYAEGVGRLQNLARRLEETRPVLSSTTPQDASPVHAEINQAAFEQMVRRAKEYIARGDIYQANLSQRFTAPMRQPPWQLYKSLREINPSPFAAYWDMGQFQIVSASPERLVRLMGRDVETRPIAGTRPRTGQNWQDEKLQEELLQNPKERAEHLMLVDLERNDLGRVCEFGSVEVSDLMALEAYSHVFHIVSNIRGKLQEDRDWVDLVGAMFPGGTITGCPKIRSMEIIDELEPVRRQFYTGSIGYVSFTGNMDLNILIRSAIVTGGNVYVQVGAGIVADSDPTREYEETLHKARALMLALEGKTADALVG
ncbi:MAG: aminodeoxychorismate synthase, component I [Candidatus Omnitrophica bacterium]|nr:aminodeoxychorismate synthase, component I [Candidatus Omnitrophota bacterium]